MRPRTRPSPLRSCCGALVDENRYHSPAQPTVEPRPACSAATLELSPIRRLVGERDRSSQSGRRRPGRGGEVIDRSRVRQKHGFCGLVAAHIPIRGIAERCLFSFRLPSGITTSRSAALFSSAHCEKTLNDQRSFCINCLESLGCRILSWADGSTILSLGFFSAGESEFADKALECRVDSACLTLAGQEYNSRGTKHI